MQSVAGFLIRHYADLSRFTENPGFLVRPFLSSVGSKLWLSYVNFRAHLDHLKAHEDLVKAELQLTSCKKLQLENFAFKNFEKIVCL